MQDSILTLELSKFDAEFNFPMERLNYFASFIEKNK